MLLVTIVFVVYGLWQVALGRNLPGLLAWGYLPRHGPKKSLTWTRARWRINGVVLLVMAAPFAWGGILSLHR